MRFQQIMLEVNYLAEIGLLLLLAACMMLRGLRAYAPVFFAYVVYSFCSTAVLYGLIHFGDAYWAWYSGWIAECLGAFIEFIVLGEIFNRLFAPYEGIRRFAKVVLLWSALLLTTFGLLTAFRYHEMHFSVPVLTAFLIMERSLKVVQLGLIVTLFCLSKYLHLRWKNLTFGIALGFGTYAIVVLAGIIVRSYFGKVVAGDITALTGAFYWLTALLWVFYVLQPDVARIPIMSLPSPELEHWDRVLSQLLKRSATSSSI
jgi:hypothetical protein